MNDKFYTECAMIENTVLRQKIKNEIYFEFRDDYGV